MTWEHLAKGLTFLFEWIVRRAYHRNLLLASAALFVLYALYADRQLSIFESQIRRL